MNQIKLIPTIYLYKGKAVDEGGATLLGDGDAVRIALCFDSNGADEILIYDISSTDREDRKSVV